jgi:tRNA (guanine37-N1)-methyltransferase
MWKARVFTLYPDLFPGPLASGLYKKAIEKNLWSLEVINIRNYATDKHKTVDDTPFGGGSGMLMRADVVANALDKNINDNNEKIIYLSPKGKKFDQDCAKKVLEKNVNIICGHFEGIDQRLLETRNIEEVSVGDFILSGGEIGALVIIDTVVRLIPGVLGNPNSLKEETFEKDLLEYPQFTKPQKWENKVIPDVLLSGDHAKINDWRLSQSKDITRRRRKDLWEKYKKKNEKY